MRATEGIFLYLYTILLRLYPRSFRREFAAEMQTVFGDALRAARRNGFWGMLRLFGREVLALPQVLAHEHWQSSREKEAGMEQNPRIISDRVTDPSYAASGFALRRWDLFLAMLPFLLLLLVDIVPKLLVESGLLAWEAPAMQAVSIASVILLIGAFLAVLFLAWRKKWPVWSATWSVFFSAAPLLLASVLLSWLYQKDANWGINQEGVLYIAIPLYLAALLYSVTRHNPLRGLLTVLPVLYLLWMFYNMEFVPDGIEIAIKVPSVALICLAIAFLLRRGDWCAGLYAVLAMNLGVGILFSYAGTYHGGTLPFSAPGPNLVEVARSLIPQYLATGAILLGPLFAWKLRQMGRYQGFSARLGYHLALAGLLLVILANLMRLMQNMNARPMSFATANRNLSLAAILLGLAVYLIGLFLVYRAAPIARRSSRWVAGWFMRALLALLPLVIPVTFMMPFITWKWPVSDLYGVPLLWVLPHGLSLSIGMAWLALSAWVVTQGSETAGPAVAVGEASGVPLLG